MIKVSGLVVWKSETGHLLRCGTLQGEQACRMGIRSQTSEQERLEMPMMHPR